MIDVEALGLNLRAPLLQFAAVMFDMYGTTGPELQVNVNPFDDNYQASFYTDHSTLEFWMTKASQEARDSLFAPPKGGNVYPLEIGLQQLFDFLAAHQPEYIWARGPQFDLRLIEFACQVCIHSNCTIDPITFDWYKVRDERSYSLGLSDDFPTNNPEAPYLKHNALADCHWQIRRIAIVNELLLHGLPVGFDA